MALTIQQLQSNLDAVNQALGNPTLKVRFPDGREVTYRSVDDLRQANAEIEENIRQASGQTGSRVRFAQHKRGDVPTGPCANEIEQRYRPDPRAIAGSGAAFELRSLSGTD